ncbi:MAG: hypothetical protein ACRENF_06775, partial [Thermodesulfobacteriota bacterium]
HIFQRILYPLILSVSKDASYRLGETLIILRQAQNERAGLELCFSSLIPGHPEPSRRVKYNGLVSYIRPSTSSGRTVNDHSKRSLNR